MKKKIIYECKNCGKQEYKWMGRCISCGSWNTFEEIITSKNKNNKNYEILKNSKPIRLNQVIASNSDRIITSINEFNRVMGGGIIKDSITIISARPGAGKSTLLLTISNDLANKGYRILYATGEESDSQIKNRANRILKEIKDNVWVISDTNMDNVLNSIKEVDPDLIIIDSIQSFTLNEFSSRPGSPIQVMECSNALLKIAKNKEKPRAIIMVGQMTKQDEMAGLRALEHLVDTVLYLEGESGEQLRILSAGKNRYGDTGEIGVFKMTEEGLIGIDNPSEFFMTKRDEFEKVSGSALGVIKEGTRSIIIEIESLVSNSFTPYPSRISECLRKEQLNTLISILEQRGRIKLYDKNVVVKTTGGLKLKEPSADLTVIISIVSSVYNIGLPNDTVFVAEVGLTGELKKVPSIENRLKELDRLGFRKVYIAKNSINKNLKFKNLEVVELKNIQEVIFSVFGNGKF